MIYDFITHFSEFHIYLGVCLSFIYLKLMQKTQKISGAKIKRVITLKQFFKRDWIENLDYLIIMKMSRKQI